jgi:hypothetical protein
VQKRTGSHERQRKSEPRQFIQGSPGVQDLGIPEESKGDMPVLEMDKTATIEWFDTDNI